VNPPGLVAAQLTSSQTCPTPALSDRDRSFGFSKRERFSVSFAHLSTSRKDAAACVSLSFLNDVKERRTRGPKSPKQPTKRSGTLEGNRLPRADCIGRRRGVDSAREHHLLSVCGYMIYRAEVSSALS
jgi:hypothetical protein